MNYNRKCKGCGNYLSSDPKSISYIKTTDNDFKYCIRCFKMKHYGEITKIESNENILNTLDNIEFKDNLIIMILDLFNLENSILDHLKHSKYILVVVNKLSCLPKKFRKEITLEKIDQILIQHGIKPIDIIMYDSNKKDNLWKIMDYVEQTTPRKTYFVGKTNVGKSSLINALLKLNKETPNLISNPIKNTTLNLIKIKIGRHQLIDTPGFPNEKSILDNISTKEITKIFNSPFDSQVYKILNKEQLFFIEKLFAISIDEFLEEENASIVFYKNSYLNVKRMKKEKASYFIETDNNANINYLKKFNFIQTKIDLNSDQKYSIFVSGISLVVLKGIKKITIYCPEEIDFSLTEKSII